MIFALSWPEYAGDRKSEGEPGGLECLLQWKEATIILKIMNADYFWLIMAAVIVIALIVQIVIDKRKSEKSKKEKHR